MMYPRTRPERAELRAQLETDAAKQACANARRLYASIRCAEGDHGCLNNGTGCLCTCHDPKEQQ
ncbi:hypothetical protein ABZX95_17405 [Streptomyces sp. NPDC004232]|uniref:hypothetical protein n=1 Tax=Streptomyces sp. NPDC004232 TaxID=3154454 RepID=UPI0033A7C7CE